jgi:anti-anti-sigma factor
VLIGFGAGDGSAMRGQRSGWGGEVFARGASRRCESFAGTRVLEEVRVQAAPRDPRDVRVVPIEGDLDLANSSCLSLLTVAAIDAGAGGIVLDLGEVSFMELTAARHLLFAIEAAAAAGVGVAIALASPEPLRLLALCGYAAEMPLVDDVAAGVARLARPGAC